MAAYLIGSVTVLDAARMARYAAEAAPIVAEFGGRRLAGGKPEVVEGDWPWGNAFVFEFPDRAAALAFWTCDAYRDLIAFRDGAAISQSVILGD
jgi:uncharacterized protein (DUF1330 family)